MLPPDVLHVVPGTGAVAGQALVAHSLVRMISYTGSTNAAIYTRDSERVFRTARRLEFGMVLSNNYFRGMLGTQFGGTKHSGYGREHAIQTLQDFGYTKMIRFPSGTGSIPAAWPSRTGGYRTSNVAMTG